MARHLPAVHESPSNDLPPRRQGLQHFLSTCDPALQALLQAHYPQTPSQENQPRRKSGWPRTRRQRSSSRRSRLHLLSRHRHHRARAFRCNRSCRLHPLHLLRLEFYDFLLFFLYMLRTSAAHILQGVYCCMHSTGATWLGGGHGVWVRRCAHKGLNAARRGVLRVAHGKFDFREWGHWDGCLMDITQQLHAVMKGSTR